MTFAKRNVPASLLFVTAFAIAFDCRGALAANPIVLDAAQACSGITSTSVRASGPIRFNDYSLSVESNGTLSVQQNGVLLRKIQAFNYSDYSKCILDLTKIMVGITAATQKLPVDIFDKARMGDFGSTALSYLQSTIGPALEISATDDVEIKEATFVADGYKVQSRFLPRENNKLVSLAVEIDKQSPAKRGEVVIDGYWNRADDPVKPGAVLGISLMRDKFSGDCFPIVEGGIITNSDPVYSCLRSGPHSHGWIGIIFHLQAPTNENSVAYDLSRLRDEVEGNGDASSPLGMERTRALERFANIVTSDEKWARIEKINAAILRRFRGFTIVGFELFNSLSSGK